MNPFLAVESQVPHLLQQGRFCSTLQMWTVCRAIVGEVLSSEFGRMHAPPKRTGSEAGRGNAAGTVAHCGPGFD